MKTHLRIGDTAPEIDSVDQDENPVLLSSYRGKKVILYFYPKDKTPGCTVQSCNLKDNYELLKKRGYEVLGVSNDSSKLHRSFIKKHTLPFTLIADTDKKVVNDYGVYGQKKMFGITFDGIYRTTFVIDANGKIEDIIDEVDTSNHTQQILKQ
jgi:peroxiredoxin Q/BCP